MVMAAASGAVLVALVVAAFAPLAASALAAEPAAALLGLLYAIADVVCVVVPALLMLLIAGRMRVARLAAPWLAVALGGLVFAAEDVAFLYQQWAGTYRGGQLSDLGWTVGAIAIALGASLAADVNLVARSSRGHDAAAATPTG